MSNPKPDYEEWVGSEEDGCYVRVYECDDGSWRNEVIVDSETGHFVDTLSECDGFETSDDAMISGRGAATEWCMYNDVDFDANAG